VILRRANEKPMPQGDNRPGIILAPRPACHRGHRHSRATIRYTAPFGKPCNVGHLKKPGPAVVCVAGLDVVMARQDR